MASPCYTQAGMPRRCHWQPTREPSFGVLRVDLWFIRSVRVRVVVWRTVRVRVRVRVAQSFLFFFLLPGYVFSPPFSSRDAASVCCFLITIRVDGMLECRYVHWQIAI